MMNLKQRQAEAYAQKLKRFFMTLDSSGWNWGGGSLGQIDLLQFVDALSGIRSCQERRNSDTRHQIELYRF